MITTVTFNPAVDKTAQVETLVTGGLNRLQNVRQALGKYQGDMEIRKEEGIFSVTMLFAAQYGEGKTQ